MGLIGTKRNGQKKAYSETTPDRSLVYTKSRKSENLKGERKIVQTLRERLAKKNRNFENGPLRITKKCLYILDGVAEEAPRKSGGPLGKKTKRGKETCTRFKRRGEFAGQSKHLMTTLTPLKDVGWQSIAREDKHLQRGAMGNKKELTIKCMEGSG